MHFGPFHLMTAFVADLLIGDPYRMPHPVRWLGSMVAKLEEILYPAKFLGLNPFSSTFLFIKGCILVGMVLLLSAVPLGAAIWWLLPYPLNDLFSLWLAFTLIAVKSLHKETVKIIDALEVGDIEEAREKLSRVVSRDTEKLDENGVMRAAVETLAENISDGIVAPILYLALGGPLLGLAYKAVNTMDSMVGYKNDRYLYFGRCAARLDDLLNFIPARITGFLISVSAALVGGGGFLKGLSASRAWHVMLRDGKLAASPNAGIPQAAMAGALGVFLGGPASYFGELVHKPIFGDGFRSVVVEDYRKAVILMYATSVLSLLLGMLILSLRQLFLGGVV